MAGKIKIAMIGDGFMTGGASIAALRLQQGLSQNGAEVVHLLTGKTGHDPSIINYGRPTLFYEFIRRISNLCNRRDVAQRFFSILFQKRIVYAIQSFSPDIINLHNLHGEFLTPALLKNFGNGAPPLVWTLHDMWALTGHCAYPLDCKKYIEEGCDADCPDPDRYPALVPGMISKAFRLRKQFYENIENLSIVTPSKWLADEVKKGILGKKSVRVIPNGIDMNSFKPIGRNVAREALGLPREKKIVLTGSFNLKAERKGWRYLESVMKKPQMHDVTLLAYGSDSNPLYHGLPFEIQMLGYVGDERLLRLYYSAADVFVLPSLADNLPNVLIESIACGTPCVAFDIGGISDVVRDGITGFLAENRNADDLFDKVRMILDMEPSAYDAMSIKCRKVAVEEYNLLDQSAKYLDYFTSLIG